MDRSTSSTCATGSTSCGTPVPTNARSARSHSSRATATCDPMGLFLIPDDFRAFMQRVVVSLDTPGQLLDGDDALRGDCGYGGRIDGSDSYQFTYLTGDGERRWSITLREAAIRNIADGLLI